MQPRNFPQYLNSPLQVLWFESDELGIMFAFLIFALMFGGVLYILMFAVPYVYGRFKKKYARGFLRHTLLSIGIFELQGYPSPFDKSFTE